MDEELEEAPALAEAAINMNRMTGEQLKKTAITSTNANTLTKAMLSKEEKVQIKIPSTEREKEAVPVGINGYVFNIPRDKWVEVPKSVLATLEEAMTTVVTVNLQSTGDRPELIKEDVNRFSVSSKPIEKDTPPVLAGSKPKETTTPGK